VLLHGHYAEYGIARGQGKGMRAVRIVQKREARHGSVRSAELVEALSFFFRR
jgi:hypothetical protein